MNEQIRHSCLMPKPQAFANVLALENKEKTKN